MGFIETFEVVVSKNFTELGFAIGLCCLIHASQGRKVASCLFWCLASESNFFVFNGEFLDFVELDELFFRLRRPRFFVCQDASAQCFHQNCLTTHSIVKKSLFQKIINFSYLYDISLILREDSREG